MFLEEEVQPVPKVVSFKKFLPFFEEIKIQIQALIEAGFKKKGFNRNVKNFQYYHEGINDSVPTLVLKMDDLEIGFLVCMIPLALSVVAFVCELAVAKIKSLTVKMRDLLTFLYFIRAVANQRKGLM